MRIFEPSQIVWDHLKGERDPRITEDHVRQVLKSPFNQIVGEPVESSRGTAYVIRGLANPIKTKHQISYAWYFGTDQIIALDVGFIDIDNEGDVVWLRYLSEISEEEYVEYVKNES